MSLMICSTSHQQRGVHLLLLVARDVFECALLHFMVYSVETVTEAF